MARKSKGRQKIQMTRMSKQSNLPVTFSKRRSGLLKKAYELQEKSIIYGHPFLYSIINRFVAGKAGPSSSSSQILETHRSASIRKLNIQLTEMLNQLEAERKHGEELIKLRKASRGRCWWEAPISDLGLQEVEQLKMAMEELKKNVTKQAQKLIVQASNKTPFLGASNSKGGGGRVGPSDDINNKGAPSVLGISMTPHGFTLLYGRGFF